MDRTYPHGVPCWVDSTTDVEAVGPFYERLLGWRFTERMPESVPGSYQVASFDGADVAAIGSGEPGQPAVWNTFIAVDDADAAAAQVSAAGGQVLEGPVDVGPPGRSVTCVDPTGAPFFLWQAGARLGAQLVNAPGTWNFSHLRTDDLAAAQAFYAAAFGWELDEVPGLGLSARVPGYGDHLAATSDPEILERQKDAPDGFEDVVGAVQPLGDETADPAGPHWHVVFTVADRDASADLVRSLGGEVHSTRDLEWSREAEVSDPAGARFTLSQFTPPEPPQ